MLNHSLSTALSLALLSALAQAQPGALHYVCGPATRGAAALTPADLATPTANGFDLATTPRLTGPLPVRPSRPGIFTNLERLTGFARWNRTLRIVR